MITDTKIINKDMKSRAHKKLQKELRLKKELQKNKGEFLKTEIESAEKNMLLLASLLGI